MRTTIGTVAGLVGGLLTSLAMVIVCLALEHYLGFGLFTIMILFVIPAGAMMTGFLASSGYYLGAKLFDARANWIMAAGMVAIAGLTQFLIYFGIYQTMQLQDGRFVHDLVGFSSFVKIYLGHQRYTIGHGGGSGVDLGNAGYALAAIQFVGFLIGGGFTFAMLKKSHFCERCERYFRKKFMLSRQGGAEYIDVLRAKAALSDEYFGALRDPQGAGFKLDVSLSECPDCTQQIVSESVQMLQKKQWKAVPQLSRTLVAANPVLSTFQMMPGAKVPLFGRFRS